MNLDAFAIKGAYLNTKCPICRIPQEQANKHFLSKCPVAAKRDLTIVYDCTKNRTLKQQAEPLETNIKSKA